MVYGSLAAGRQGPIALNALTGLGTVLQGDRHRLLGGLVGGLLPLLLDGRAGICWSKIPTTATSRFAVASWRRIG